MPAVFTFLTFLLFTTLVTTQPGCDFELSNTANLTSAANDTQGCGLLVPLANLDTDVKAYQIYLTVGTQLPRVRVSLWRNNTILGYQPHAACLQLSSLHNASQVYACSFQLLVDELFEGNATRLRHDATHAGIHLNHQLETESVLPIAQALTRDECGIETDLTWLCFDWKNGKYQSESRLSGNKRHYFGFQLKQPALLIPEKSPGEPEDISTWPVSEPLFTDVPNETVQPPLHLHPAIIITLSIVGGFIGLVLVAAGIIYLRRMHRDALFINLTGRRHNLADYSNLPGGDRDDDRNIPMQIFGVETGLIAAVDNSNKTLDDDVVDVNITDINTIEDTSPYIPKKRNVDVVTSMELSIFNEDSPPTLPSETYLVQNPEDQSGNNSCTIM